MNLRAAGQFFVALPLALLPLSACKDTVPRYDGSIPSDLAIGGADLGVPPDLTVPLDFAIPADLTAPVDLVVPPDLSKPPVRGLSFAAPRLYFTFTNTRSVATGDLNGDGCEDVVAAGYDNAGDRLVSQLASANGYLGAPLTLASGSTVRMVLLRDLNGDGKLDVALIREDTRTVEVLLGHGDGSFDAAVSYGNADAPPLSIAAGDVTGDGKIDLVVGNSSGNSIHVLRGNGDGTFQAPAPFNGGTPPAGLVLDDFNGDGTLDIAAVDDNQSLGGGRLSVALGQGGGAFQTPVTYTVGSSPRAITAGDFNKDGRPDLAIANTGTFQNFNYVNSTVAVLLNDGRGGFGVPVSYTAAAPGSGGIVARDFNGDGELDLAVTAVGDLTYVGGLSVMNGRGDGSFGSAVSHFVGNRPSSPVVGDFNGDGRPDLVNANEGSSIDRTGGGFTVTFNGGAQGLVSALAVPSGFRVGLARVGDINKDGVLDVVTYTRSRTEVYYHQGLGGGRFGAGTQYIPGTWPSAGRIVDLNGDGNLDIVTANQSSKDVTLLFGNGLGGFQIASPRLDGDSASTSSPSDIVAGDFNGDGRNDLAMTNFGTGNIYVYLNLGGGTFAAPRIVTNTRGLRGILANDLNRDGNLDLVVLNPSAGGVAVYLGTGQGDFTLGNGYTIAQAFSFGGGDFNGDGNLDVVVASSTFGDPNGAVTVLLGQGNGQLQPTGASYPCGPSTVALTVGDFDGDGKDDVAVSNNNTGSVTVALGNGAGGFGAPLGFAVGLMPWFSSVGDMNNDGKLDIVVGSEVSVSVPNQSPGAFTVLFNQSR